MEQQKTKACVTADPALKLRAEPDGEVLAKIPYREVVEVLELDWDTEWAKISYNGTVGYVMMKYIKITEGPESFVITAEPKTYKAKEEEKDPEKETGMFTRAIPEDAAHFKVYFENPYGIWTHTMIKI